MTTIGLNSNIASLKAQRQLDRASGTLQRSYERLSSGMRINRASDDAAGLAIATQLNSSSRVYTQGIRNVQDAISYLTIADGAAEALTSVLFRIGELANQAANGTYSTSQRTALDSEAQALRSEFNRIMSTTQFNGQNLLDGSSSSVFIEVGEQSTNRINVALSSVARTAEGDGTFSTWTTYGTGVANAFGLENADFNRDGIQDLIISSNTDFTAKVLIGNSDGSFNAPISYQLTASATLGGTIKTVDLNNDSYMDAVFAGITDDKLFILFGNGNGTFIAPVSYAGGDAAQGISAADVNSDGYADIISTSTNDDRVNITLANSNGTFKAPISISPLASSDPWSISLEDVNRDGQIDIVTTLRATAVSAVAVMFGNGNATFKAAVTYATNANPRALSLVDVDGDGYKDIVTGHDGTEDVMNVLIANGDGTFKARVSYVAVHTVVDFQSEDVNGDGVADLEVSSNNSGFQVFIGNGDGTFKAFTSYGPSVNNPQYQAVYDANGDGTKDIITASSGNGNIHVRFGQNSNSLFTISLLNQVSARKALDNVTAALTRLESIRGNGGALQSRLDIAGRVLQTTRENYQASASKILDVDVAEETANLVASQIRQQVTSSILAQANQAPALALLLLK